MLEMAQEQVPSTSEENTHGKVYRTGRSRVKLHARAGRPEWQAAGLAVGGDEREALIKVVRAVPGQRHLCLEEGTLDLLTLPGPRGFFTPGMPCETGRDILTIIPRPAFPEPAP